MKPSTFLRTLSSKLSPTPSSSSSVAPWPPVRTAFDRWLSSELDGLRLHRLTLGSSTSAAWLSKALHVATAVQKSLLLAANRRPTPVDRSQVDHYLECLIEFLDALEAIGERLQLIKKYTDSTSIAVHCLEGDYEPSAAAVNRAKEELSRCAAVEKNLTSNMRRLGGKTPPQAGTNCSEFHEMLTASRAVAALIISMAGAAISFKPRRGVANTIPLIDEPWRGSSWGREVVELSKEAKEECEKRRRGGLEELDAVALGGRRVRELLRCGGGRREEVKREVELLKKRCGELEERVGSLEEKVDELYRELIGIRVDFLGMFTDDVY